MRRMRDMPRRNDPRSPGFDYMQLFGGAEVDENSPSSSSSSLSPTTPTQLGLLSRHFVPASLPVFRLCPSQLCRRKQSHNHSSRPRRTTYSNLLLFPIHTLCMQNFGYAFRKRDTPAQKRVTKCALGNALGSQCLCADLGDGGEEVTNGSLNRTLSPITGGAK